MGTAAARERNARDAEAARQPQPTVRCANCDKPSSYHRKTVGHIGFCGSNCAKFGQTGFVAGWSFRHDPGCLCEGCPGKARLLGGSRRDWYCNSACRKRDWKRRRPLEDDRHGRDIAAHSVAIEHMPRQHEDEANRAKQARAFERKRDRAEADRLQAEAAELQAEAAELQAALAQQHDFEDVRRGRDSRDKKRKRGGFKKGKEPYPMKEAKNRGGRHGEGQHRRINEPDSAQKHAMARQIGLQPKKSSIALPGRSDHRENPAGGGARSRHTSRGRSSSRRHSSRSQSGERAPKRLRRSNKQPDGGPSDSGGGSSSSSSDDGSRPPSRSDSDEDSDSEAIRARETQAEELLRLGAKKFAGVSGIPLYLQNEANYELYREVGLGATGSSVHLISIGSQAGWTSGSAEPMQAKGTDLALSNTPVLASYFVAKGAVGKLKPDTTGSILVEADGTLRRDTSAAVELSGPIVNSKLSLLVLLRHQWFLHIDDPDHKAKFKVNEEVGSLNYCIYIRQMEMEISNDLLQRLDSHLMTARFNGAWSFDSEIPDGLRSTLANGQPQSLPAIQLRCWVCSGQHSAMTCPNVCGKRTAPAMAAAAANNGVGGGKRKAAKPAASPNGGKPKQAKGGAGISPKKAKKAAAGGAPASCHGYNSAAGCTRAACRFSHTCEVCKTQCGASTAAPWGRRACA